MRRNSRRRPEEIKWWEDKNIILSSSIFFIVVALIIGIAIYSTDDGYSNTNEKQIISLTPENEIENNTSAASTNLGKNVEESQNEINTSDIAKNDNANIQTTNNAIISNTTNKNAITKSKETVKKQSTPTNTSTEEKNSIDFDWPVKGEILKAFSIDNLLYSSTLQEWTIHNGIDIKADKTTVVGAAADGTVKSIKNDPRYGLTVIIEHEDGYRTVYSNLLTAEFVVEGEKVNKGQTIGSIGNSANFEVADDTHLHFEMLKDGEHIDPILHLK